MVEEHIELDYLLTRIREEFTFRNKVRKLIVITGLFGDFDSIEYAQALYPKLDILSKSNIELVLIGIGNKASRSKFSEYTKIPIENIMVVSDNKLHRKLELSQSFKFSFSKYLDFFMMCLGYRSPGTLREVLRGYLGDRSSDQRVFADDKINIANVISLKGELFNVLGSEGNLRPFELATIRLVNMIEIIQNWDIYIPYPEFLTQRGATFLVNSENELLYSFKSTSLLIFSETVHKPLDFLEPFWDKSN